MDDILQNIMKRKREEVTTRSAATPLDELKARIAEMPVPRGFADALRAKIAVNAPAVIAEIKRASPSQGLIRDNFWPSEIAISYEKSGAACLSVLTDADFFQGTDEHLRQAREACLLPALRKDFTIDAYQLYESRSLGADCVLLIVAALDDAQLRDYSELARELGMDVLVEAHDAAEVDRALKTSASLIGINNRDLRTFQTSLDTTLTLREKIPSDRILVTESGIRTRDDVKRMRDAGVHAFLVGETFMRADDPGAELETLFG
ncbi:MAG TPA: indole-3-glycerol phosphate synthase TrpC [Rudaea sp.]|jgi:indole-3-glycerol phosphate synthase|nr:indole-3-glycerol phosphate synthase TrpC [Rudaea sp.]